ncbi:MAG: CobD/CbiB family protein [Betaproteobacteria bacterium]
MSFFAILFALLLEQVRPLSPGNPVHAMLRAWARWVRRNFDTGRAHHGGFAWVMAVLLPAAITLAVHWTLLWWVGWPLAVLWNVAVLYVTLGFRQFSHHFTDIRDALDAGDEARARELLAGWQQVNAADLPKREIVRHVIEYSVLAAHRHVFGVLCWFSLLAAFGLGPTGAVMYRLSEFVGRYWNYKSATQQQPVSEALQTAANQAWRVLDWLPARITALGFAVVGSFEDAIEAWRAQAQLDPQDSDAIILAATAGAINVRLGGETLVPAFASAPAQGLHEGAPEPLTSATAGREPELAHLRSVVGLVWRSVVMWLVLLALLTLARLLG